MDELKELLLALTEMAKEENTNKEDGVTIAAKHTHKLYETLISVGFTEEQAFELVKTLLGKDF